MPRSFVRQGMNIICSNMTISTPRKLGLNPAKESVETAGITIYSTASEPLLNILDKKLDDCFKCKVPQKNWGGLAAFFAGVAIAAVVVVVVLTAPVSGPIIAAIASVALVEAAVTVAAVTVAVAATCYSVYKTSHECDRIFDAKWQNYHETVFIEKEHALLDSSFMICPVGGRLEIIIDNVLAQSAAEIISRANNDDIFWTETNKLINGIIAFATGGPFGASIASAIEFYNTATDDGKDKSVFDDAVDATIDSGIGFGADTGKTLAEKVMYGHSYSWGAFVKDLKKGIYGAVVGFAIDQFFKSTENDDERDAKNGLNIYNNEDEHFLKRSENAINIISTTQK